MAEDTGLRVTANFQQVIGRLGKAMPGPQLNAAMHRAMTKTVLAVHKRVIDKLSGPVLKVDEGFLRNQMQWEVSADGRVGLIGTNLEYAAIHEFGGVTKPHQIEVHDFDSALPISVRATGIRSRAGAGGANPWLAVKAGPIFRASVNHPGAVIPERPYLRPSLAETREEAKANLAAELAGLMRGGA